MLQLAKRGLSVVLIGRSEDKLKQVAEELGKTVLLTLTVFIAK